MHVAVITAHLTYYKFAPSYSLRYGTGCDRVDLIWWYKIGGKIVINVEEDNQKSVADLRRSDIRQRDLMEAAYCNKNHKIVFRLELSDGAQKQVS